MRSLINGEWADCLPIADRGLHYGDGLFETLAVERGRVLGWDAHLQRLGLGCQRLGLPMPDKALLATERERLLAKVERGVLKIILTRGQGGRGYRPPQPAQANRILALHPWPGYPSAWWRHGVDVRLCETRIGVTPALAGMKHLNRLEQVLARAEWRDPAIAEGLMLDPYGHLICGTTSNLFLLTDDTLLTPDLGYSGISGIIRAGILEEADRQGMQIRIGAISPEALWSASEVFISNSLWGVLGVRRVDDRALSRGKIGTQLRGALVATGLVAAEPWQ